MTRTIRTATPTLAGLLAVIACLALTVHAADPVVVTRDIAYAPGTDYPYGDRLLDVHAPAAPGPHPVLIWVHGGGWRNGDKVNVQLKDDVFVDAGYVFVSVNYRLAADRRVNPSDLLIGVVRWEHQAADVAAAIAWVTAHIDAYGGDPQRIFLMGHSAGAHLISLVSTDESYLAAQGVPLSRVRGVISLDTPIYNLPLLNLDKPLTTYWTDLAGTTEAEWERGSPSFHVAPGKGIPPFYVAYTHGSTLDDPALESRIHQCDDFTVRLSAASVPFDLRGHPELTHGEITVNFGEPGDVVTSEAFAFLDARTYARDDAYWSRPGQTLSVGAAEGVLGNDIRPSDVTVTATLASPPAHGTVTLNTTGAFDYLPAPGWSGGDSFTYTATFGTGEASTATVRLDLDAGAPRSLADLDVRADYYAGDYPPEADLYGATEANALEIHDGLLYLATSYMPAQGGASAVDPKILVKRSATEPWEVDYHGTSRFSRFGILKSVTFTTDGTGVPLPRPVPVLFAGTGQWRFQDFQHITIMSRGAMGAWVATDVSDDVWNPNRSNDTQEVRVIFDHVDRVTGVHHVFAGSNAGKIFRGVYDPTQPGLVRWEPTPDIDGCYGRFLAATEANGVAYVLAGISRDKDELAAAAGAPLSKRAGIYRRIDGPAAHWEWVDVPGWANVASNTWAKLEYPRGLTAIRNPSTSTNEVLLIGQVGIDLDGDGTKQSRIERLDPANGFAVTTELDVDAFLRGAFGRSVPVVSAMPYNDMLPTVHPDTGESSVLIGAWFVPDQETTETGKKSWYLVRHEEASYELGEIWDETHPLTGAAYGLRGSRSIRPSPFADDRGRVWYFCGFDQTGGARGPAAWVYRGSLPPLAPTTTTTVTQTPSVTREADQTATPSPSTIPSDDHVVWLPLVVHGNGW